MPSEKSSSWAASSAGVQSSSVVSGSSRPTTAPAPSCSAPVGWPSGVALDPPVRGVGGIGVDAGQLERLELTQAP